MFQIGMGRSPPIPKSVLPSEGHQFLSYCFRAKPDDRWKASHLLTHPFVKVCMVGGQCMDREGVCMVGQSVHG